MKTPFFFSLFDGPLVCAAAACTTLLLAGCVSQPPELDTQAMVTQAARLGNAIEVLDQPEPLDWQGPLPSPLAASQAAELAVRHSPAVQTALAQVQAALAQARHTRLLPNPVLSLALRVPDGGGSEVLDAGLSQPLIALFQRPGKAKAADAKLRMAAQHAVATALNTVRDAELTYAATRAAQAQRDVLREQAQLLERLLDLAHAQLDAGEATRLDVAGFEARQASLNAKQLAAQAQVQFQQLALARLLGQPSRAADFNLAPAKEPEVLETESALLAQALQARPELQAAGFELIALGAHVRLAKWEPWNGTNIGVDSETQDDDTAWGPALDFPIPLFDFGQETKTQARADLLAAKHQLLNLRRIAVQEVRQAYAAAKAAATAMQLIDDQLLPLQTQRLDQTKAAYQAGFVSVTDVLQAERDLLDAQSQGVEARKQQQTAAAELRHATGGAMPQIPTHEKTP